MRTSQVALAHFDAKAFNSVFSFPKPRGIYETQGPFATIDHSFESITRGTGNLRYNCAGSTQKYIEERRLPGIRRARDNYDCAIADDLPGRPGGEECFERPSNSFRGLVNLFSRNRPIILLREINIVDNQRL